MRNKDKSKKLTVLKYRNVILGIWEQMESHSRTEAISLRAYGIVQRVGFRRFVERVAWNFKLGGYVENLKDGSVRITVQGPSDSLEGFISEVKKPPAPIHIEKLDSKNVKVVPSMKYFRVKNTGGVVVEELQEGFGAMEAQFNDYRGEFKSYRSEFRDFAERTDQNFKSLDTKYGEISDKLTTILTTLETESNETRRQLTRAVDSLVAAVEKGFTRNITQESGNN